MIQLVIFTLLGLFVFHKACSNLTSKGEAGERWITSDLTDKFPFVSMFESFNWFSIQDINHSWESFIVPF